MLDISDKTTESVDEADVQEILYQMYPQSDDLVYIELSRLHCTVTSKIDEKELLFKSDSANWNTELFTRLDVEPEQYLTKTLSTYDPKATLNY